VYAIVYTQIDALPLGCDLSVQFLPDDRRFRVAGSSTVKYHVRILFGNDVFGTFDNSRLLCNVDNDIHVNIIYQTTFDTQSLLRSASRQRNCFYFGISTLSTAVGIIATILARSRVFVCLFVCKILERMRENS